MGRKKRLRGRERRKFVRLDYTTPLALKVCKKATVSRILEGYTADISQIGLLCKIKERVKKNDLLWLSFDRATLTICAEIEKRSLIYQNGVIGKVVRVSRAKNGLYSVGIQFLTREEKNSSHIYPKIKFLHRRKKALAEIEEEEAEQGEPEQLEEIVLGDRQQKERVEPEREEKEEDEEKADLEDGEI
jgi:hypothetical protein